MGSSHIRVAFDCTLSSLALIKVGVLFFKTNNGKSCIGHSGSPYCHLGSVRK